MLKKNLALIGFAALALTAYGVGFAGSEAAMEKQESQEAADAAQKFADEKQAEAEAAVKEGASDIGAKIDEAAAAENVAAEKMEEAAK